jgi:hypothetical protein
MMQSLGLRVHDQSQEVSVQPHAATICGYEFTHKRTAVFRVVYPFAYTVAQPM